MSDRRYNLINNIGGWAVFVIALVTYWLTLEPTASYWDCGEFIIQADKLEVGHPPGNPIFMLTARFFANFASDSAHIAVMVNAMSGLLSALTILLLFWTISHLVRRLVVKDGHRGPISIQQYIAIMGSALVGSLAYCWSDTFWFSAVEGEVYAFSSFCTALVFWLILKWEDRADAPHSDRYLILIAYIIGVSVAVHLLNLLCIPAIVLVFAYKKWPRIGLSGSLVALVLSFVIVFFVLYGLVPGFIKVAQRFELLFVNGMGMSFNSGAIAYAIVMTASFIWCLHALQAQRSALMIRLSVLVTVTLTGMLFVGSGWVIGVVLTLALAALLWLGFRRRLPVRMLNVAMWSCMVIFIGYSSYALILIRSTADTPMNQNSPDNVFDLATYLNREQYGENPLIYGETLYSQTMREVNGMRNDTVGQYSDGSYAVASVPNYSGQVVNPGKAIYAKGVSGAEPKSEYHFLSPSEIASNRRLAERGGDYYVVSDYRPRARMNPELDMFFPRLYSRQHASSYANWVRLDTMPDQLKGVTAVDVNTGQRVPELDIYAQPIQNEVTGAIYFPEKKIYKPTYAQNLAYFFNYQLNHMYLRYFMWNFAGRQNDVNNQRGELDAGNWVSGIGFIDNLRLGDQQLLPDTLGAQNKGHNVYYFLPLILGIIGLIWQSFAGRRGIEQFWVVFFLFFMTGIAIVIYLNQTPDQPRERDYAFAGSFYAFAIWIGMGVAGLWRILMWLAARRTAPKQEKKEDDMLITDASALRKADDEEEPIQSPAIVDEPASLRRKSLYCAAVALVIGIVVPLQMVSQTWDDHDRSGRTAARDYAINYLESLEPNAIVFCNGDNDTFPLWYAQEVEGVRPDVRIINLSYLTSEWYANQHRMTSYEAAPAPMTATPEQIAYGRQDVTVLPQEKTPVDLLTSLKALYSGLSIDSSYGYPQLPSAVVSIPVDKELVVKRGLVAPADTARIVDDITIDLSATTSYRRKGYLSLGEILMLDIIATNAAEGWPRPIYWATTVGDDYHLGLTPYLRSTGMTHQLVPTVQSDKETRTDRAYATITGKYLWGGADAEKSPYFDETARRMLYAMRLSMVDLSSMLVYDADLFADKGDTAAAREAYTKAISVLRLMESKLREGVQPIDLSNGLTMAQVYITAGEATGDTKARQRGMEILRDLLERNARTLRYYSEVTLRFRNPSLTYDTQLIPYQYYRIISLYTEYGGKMEEVEKILKTSGFTVDMLRGMYESAYGNPGATTNAGESGIALEDLTVEILQYCEIANRLASLSPEEYAATSADERQIDSLLIMAIDYYRQAGGTEAELMKYDQWQQLDRQRSQRLYDEYIEKATR